MLAALNPEVFFGYFSVCADGGGHGSNTTFPGLDWGQSAEALLWLGRRPEVLASWEYVKGFQQADGRLPFAVIPDLANPIYGPDELIVDGWIGWGRPLALGGVDGQWKFQLNVRNLLDDDDLIPVVANPDLSIPVYRIPSARTWELRSTYRF